MGVYLGLIVFILLLPLVVSSFFKKRENKQHAIILLGMAAIFLILALKGDVGADIAGYKEQYNISAEKAWDDVDYVYFESGYITLMKVFSKTGFSFQVFMIFVYSLACFAIFLFIKKYSKDAVFSLIIFVCYQFFVFYISGIRQCIAMSICIIAFLIFQNKKVLHFLTSITLILIAVSIHQSALIFLFVPIIALIKSPKINVFVYLAGFAISIVARPWIWAFVNKYLREIDTEIEITLGGNFVMLCILSVAMFFINTKNGFLNLKPHCGSSQESTLQDVFFTRMTLFAVFAQVLFSGHAMLRASMYWTLFLIPGLPNTVKKLEYKTSVIVKCCFIVFFICLFYIDTLIPNQLELLPYELFWQ